MLDNISVNAHSSIRIADKLTLYVDPFRIEGEPHDADLILFTHPHYDHFSPEDFRKLAREDTLFVCPLSMKAEALAAGIRPERLNPLVAEENLGVLGALTILVSVATLIATFLFVLLAIASIFKKDNRR